MPTDQQRAEGKVTEVERLAKNAATRTGGLLVRLLARTREEGEDIWAEAQSISRSLAPPQPITVSRRSAASAVEPVCSLPLVGPTTVEDGIFYTAVGAVAILGLVSWPTAGLIGTGHALHQRARNVVRAGTVGEAREGLIEAFEDVV
jgi:hypothetical protein